MQRRIFMLTSALAIAGATTTAWAQDYTTGILAQLRDLGFEQIEMKRTLLGRTRILATNSEGQREIILNPNTGEILRDLWIPENGSGGPARLVDNSGKGGGSSGGSGGNGSGSGGSGSGSGSSGSGGSDDNDDSESGSDNSGSGNSDDEDDDNSSGSGGGDDDDDDNSSGSGGGDDDDDDDDDDD